MSKQERRSDMKAKLSLIGEAELKIKSSELSKNLLQLFSELHIIEKNLLFGAFAPFDREPFWNVEFGVEFQKLTAFPALEEDSVGMCFKKAAIDELVVNTNFGSKIPGPKEDAERVLPSLLLVPGLAMSSKGERLGRGKGFYDRYMENFRGLKVGVCFQVQIDETLPVEKHDILLDYVVTELRIINCKKA